MPCGKPNLLEPSLAKQDINQMVKDLTKYHQTGLFPQDARDKWENLLSTFNSVYGSIPSPHPEWILNDFKPVSERITEESITPVISDPILKQSNAAKQIRKVRK